MIIKAKLKSIGGSLGICQAIPKSFIVENKLREESDILIEIKENPLKSLWNSGLRTKRSSQQIKDDMREEWNK
jgi:hypothetical protein